jgi:hypothetical protein
MNKKLKEYGKSILKIMIMAVIATIILSINAYAETVVDTSPLDNIVDWMAVWAGKVGLVIAFFGGIQTALSFKNDDAEAKVRGIKTLTSGVMVFGITKALNLFGL